VTGEHTIPFPGNGQPNYDTLNEVYTYDDANRLTGFGDTTHFAYDPAGRLQSRTLPDQEMDNYYYDDAGRLRGIKETGPAGGNEGYLARYMARNAAGFITYVTDSQFGQANYAYDAMNRLTGRIGVRPGIGSIELK